MSARCATHDAFAAGCGDCQAAENERYSNLRLAAQEAAVTFRPGGDPSGLAPLTPDGRLDVRAQLLRWDGWANRGAATGPSASDPKP